MTPISPLQTEPGTRLSWVGGGEGATERKEPLAGRGTAHMPRPQSLCRPSSLTSPKSTSSTESPHVGSTTARRGSLPHRTTTNARTTDPELNRTLANRGLRPCRERTLKVTTDSIS